MGEKQGDGDTYEPDVNARVLPTGEWHRNQSVALEWTLPGGLRGIREGQRVSSVLESSRGVALPGETELSRTTQPLEAATQADGIEELVPVADRVQHEEDSEGSACASVAQMTE